MASDQNIVAGWLLYSSLYGQPSPMLKDLDDLDPVARRQFIAKLERISTNAGEIGYRDALPRRLLAGPTYIFPVKIPSRRQFKVAVALLNQIPVIIDFAEENGKQIQNETFMGNVQLRTSILQATLREANEHYELRVLETVDTSINPHAVVRPAAKQLEVTSQPTPIVWSDEQLNMAHQVNVAYSDLASLLERLMSFRVRSAARLDKPINDLSVLRPIKELRETEFDLQAIRQAVAVLSEKATEFGHQFVDTKGTEVPLVRKVLGTVTKAQMSKPWAAAVLIEAGLMVAIHIAENLPLDADAKPFGPLPLQTEGSAQAYWLSHVAGLIEAQTARPNMRRGTGFETEVLELLTANRSASNVNLAADVIAVKAAGGFEQLSSVPDIEWMI